jgi:hypothetical protein
MAVNQESEQFVILFQILESKDYVFVTRWSLIQVDTDIMGYLSEAWSQEPVAKDATLDEQDTASSVGIIQGTHLSRQGHKFGAILWELLRIYPVKEDVEDLKFDIVKRYTLFCFFPLSIVRRTKVFRMIADEILPDLVDLFVGAGANGDGDNFS